MAGRSKCVNREAPKYLTRVERIAGGLGVPSCSELGEGDVGIEVWTGDDELPGVIESGMPRKNGQRKPGTTRGSPRREGRRQKAREAEHHFGLRIANDFTSEPFSETCDFLAFPRSNRG